MKMLNRVLRYCYIVGALLPASDILLGYARADEPEPDHCPGNGRLVYDQSYGRKICAYGEPVPEYVPPPMMPNGPSSRTVIVPCNDNPVSANLCKMEAQSWCMDHPPGFGGAATNADKFPNFRACWEIKMAEFRGQGGTKHEQLTELGNMQAICAGLPGSPACAAVPCPQAGKDECIWHTPRAKALQKYNGAGSP
jgi:hypothetical protein